MIQSPATQYQPLSRPLKINFDNRRTNLQYLNDDEESFSEDDHQGPLQYDDVEEEEDCNTVFGDTHRKKKISLREERLKAEKRNERNQQILQSHPLIFAEVNPPISFKKLKRLSRPQSKVKVACYIPERNILIAVLSKNKTIHIYSTMNFNLIAVKKSQENVTCLSYSKHLGKIVVGGDKHLLQLWNPRTFNIEAESSNKGNNWFHSVAYVSKSDIIAAETYNRIEIYNVGLREIKSFSLLLKPGAWFSEGTQFQSISRFLLLASVCYEKQQRVFLLNLKTKTNKEFTNIFVPAASCVARAQHNPQPIFSCLACPEDEVPGDFTEWSSFPLTQLTLDPQTEEFSIVRKAETVHSFSKLSRLENSKCLLAQKFTENNGFEMFMLSIKKDHVEIVKILSRPSSQIILNKIGIYIMMKEGSSVIVEVREKSQLNIYGMTMLLEK